MAGGPFAFVLFRPRGAVRDRWCLIHLLAGWTLLSAPLGLLAARRHNVAQHRKAMMGLFYGGVLVAGALAFIPGRILWNVFL